MSLPGGARRFAAPALPGVAVLLAAFLLTQYGYAWRVPFINDDFVFLDLTRGASFLSLWVPRGAVWLWYRPWSRELHYWALHHLFGTAVGPWHLASFALWLALTTLYFALVRRLAGARAAAVATAGAAALAAWGLPVVWVAGVQDLWMVTLSLGALLAFARGRTAIATLLFAPALLSKETAALLPAAAFVLAWRVEGRRAGAALRRTAPLLVVAGAWALAHPLLGGRLWHGPPPPAPVAGTPAWEVAGRTLLALANLDALPRPELGWRHPLVVGALGALALVALAGWGLRARRAEPPVPAGRLAAFAAAWAIAGWAPLLAPSLGWHAYYGLFGMLGAWLLVGPLLARRGVAALVVIVALALLRAGRADTPARDWGEEGYQKRAAEFIAFMRQDLAARHPAFAPHSRLYFIDVPSSVGFLAGDAPALRVWYGEPSLRGGLFSSFRARRAVEPRGADYFFRYDSTAGWVEIHTGAEDLARARAADPRWREDHEGLAVTLSRGGDWAGAGQEYEKLERAFPADATYPYYAGLAALAGGDTATARARLDRAAALPAADDEIRAAARALGLRPAPRPAPRR